MSVFDPDSFMSTPTDAGSTRFENIPIGEYMAMVESATVRGTANGGAVCDLVVLLNAPEISAQLNRPKLTIKTGIFLDLDSNGKLDMSKGKNVKLNRLREALGQNTPGWTFSKLNGAGPLKVITAHRKDKDSDDVFYDDIKSFGKA